MMNRRKTEVAAFLVAVLGIGSVLAVLPVEAARAADDVKVFSKPPSVDELRDALGTKGGAGGAKFKTRSIQIDSDEPVAPAAAASAASAPSSSYAPSTAYQPAAAPAPVKKHKAAPAATAVVSEKAVAMQIKFDYNSAVIRPESLPFIESIAKLLLAEPQSKLVIEGHTDAAGSDAYNLQLSRSRAASVRDTLVQQFGISAARLISIGKGPAELLTPTDPLNADNRRVQFRLRA